MGKHGNKVLKAFWRALLLSLLGLLLGINFYNWNAKNLVGNRMPMPFGYGICVVLSGSMEPVLAVDDLVFIRETQDIAVGDIIVYQSGQELIIHRVVGLDGQMVVTKGDANNVADEPFDLSAVKGKMTGRIPAVGALVRLLKKPVVVVAVLALAFYLMERSFRHEKKQGDEELEKIKEEIRALKESGQQGSGI
jgi:signal peptidase